MAVWPSGARSRCARGFRDGATERTPDRCRPRSPVSSAAWQRQPPKSTSRRSTTTAGLGHPAVPRKRLNASESRPDPAEGSVPDVLEPQPAIAPAVGQGSTSPTGIDGQVAPAPAAEAGLGAVVEVIGPDVEDRHPPAEPGPGLRGDRLGLLDLVDAGEQRGLGSGTPSRRTGRSPARGDALPGLPRAG